MVKKANQRAALIHRSFLSKNYEQPHFGLQDIPSVLSSNMPPQYETHLKSIWSILSKPFKKKFTKRLPGLSGLSYPERLTILYLQSLEHRRLQFDLVTCFKIVHNQICLDSSDFFIFSPNNRSRGHPFSLIVPLVKSNIKKHLFSCRVVRPWNHLPSTMVTNLSSIFFKSQLKKINLDKFLIHPSITLIWPLLVYMCIYS